MRTLSVLLILFVIVCASLVVFLQSGEVPIASNTPQTISQPTKTPTPPDVDVASLENPTTIAPTPEMTEDPLRSQREVIQESPTTIPAGTGLVVDAAGAPIEGATIHIVPCPDDRREDLMYAGQEAWLATGIIQTSAGDGSFPIHLLDSTSSHAIVVRKPTYAFEHVVRKPGDEGEVVITMQTSKRLSGIVVDKQGNPLKGVDVRHARYYIWETSYGWDTAEALAMELVAENVTTNTSGEFEFVEVGSYLHSVKAHAQGYAPNIQHEIADDSELRLILVPSATLHGRVTNVEGDPLPGALVRTMAHGSLPEQQSDWAKVDEYGNYQILDAHSGSISVVVWAEKDYATQRIRTAVPTGATTRFDIVMQEESKISGRTVFPNGEPAANIPIMVKESVTGYTKGEVITDANGQFTVRGLRGDQPLNVLTHSSREWAGRDILHVAPGTDDLEIVVYPWGTVTGDISFDGPPPEIVRVRTLFRGEVPEQCALQNWSRHLYDNMARSKIEVDGDRFSFRKYSGVFDLEFWAPGYGRLYVENVTIRACENELDVPLDFTRPSEIWGRVVDAKTQTGIDGATVAVLDEYLSGTLIKGRRCQEMTTRPDGSFVSNEHRDKDFSVRVIADGYAPKTVRSLPNESVIALEPAGRLEGKIVTDYVDPASVLIVEVREIGCEDGVMTKVGHDGTFVLENTPIGLVEVVLTDNYQRAGFHAIEPLVRQVTIPSGETKSIVIDAATGVTLHGRILGGDLSLLIQAKRVDEIGGDSIAGASYTDQDGSFRIPHLRPGTYRIGSSIGRPGSSMGFWKTVTLESSSNEEIVIDIGDTLLSGRLLDSGGTPIPRGLVAVYSGPLANAPVAICLSDYEGMFRIGGIKEGLYDIVVRARGFASRRSSGHSVPGDLAEISMIEESTLEVIALNDVGAPLSGAEVVLKPLPPDPVLHQTKHTLDSGHVVFTRIPAGPSLLSASLEGHVAAKASSIRIRDEGQQTIQVELVRLGRLRVKAESNRRLPVPGLKVSLLDEDGNSWPEEPPQTNRKGIVIIEDLPPGLYEVAIDNVPEDEVEIFPGELTRFAYECLTEDRRGE